MNERIQELAEQAGLQCHKDEAICFAEMIVKECAMFGMVITDDHFDVEALYKHFGIKS